MRQDHKSSSLHQLIPRKIFDRLAKKWEVDKGVTKFSTWEMTHALLAALVNRLGSYREVEGVLRIPDSTFADALRVRHFGFFEELADSILMEIRAKTRDRKVKKAIRQLLAIDSSECRVHGSLFDQPSWRQKGCDGRKASLKLHVVWNVNGEWIDDFAVTGGCRNDLTVAKTFSIKKGAMYVYDRAYVDLNFWMTIMSQGSDFVTRLKRTPRKKAVHEYVLSPKDLKKTGVLWEGQWTPSEAACYRNSIKPRELKLRHVIYRDKETGRIFDFITSDWNISAQEVADIYKRRWAVELLFRWLKGHLNIRYFPAKNKNAIRIQCAIAVTLQMLLQLKRLTDQANETLWEILRKERTASLQKGLMDSGVPADCRWNTAAAAGCAA